MVNYARVIEQTAVWLLSSAYSTLYDVSRQYASRSEDLIRALTPVQLAFCFASEKNPGGPGI